MIWWQMELLEIETNYLVMSMVTNTIQIFNSCSNPIVYVLRTEAFRDILTNIFKWPGDLGQKTTADPRAIVGRVDVY
jgi:hypothetical protein